MISKNLLSDQQADQEISAAQTAPPTSTEPTMQLLFNGFFADASKTSSSPTINENVQQSKKRSLEQYDGQYLNINDTQNGERLNKEREENSKKLIKMEPTKDEKVKQLSKTLMLSAIECEQLLEKNDWSVNIAKAAQEQQNGVKKGQSIIVEEEKSSIKDQSPGKQLKRDDKLINESNQTQQQNNQEENIEVLRAITGCTISQAQVALKETMGNIERAERYLEVQRQKIPPELSMKMLSIDDSQYSDQQRAVELLKTLTNCSSQEAENALKECQGNIEFAERYLGIFKATIPSQLPKDFQSQEVQENEHTRAVELLKALTNCSLQQAEDALKECYGNIELAEKLIQVQDIKQTHIQAVADTTDLIKPIQQQNDQSQRLDLPPPRSLKELQEEATILQALIKCSPYTALEALKVLHDYKTAETFLRKAIDFCRGDEEQALRLITVNPLEFGAINELVPCQRRALDFIATKAKAAHLSAYPKLVERFEKLGYNVLVLEQVLKYIRDDAPIIIHFNCNNVLEKFVKDTHYRSMFEIIEENVYDARYMVESQLFGKHYDKCKAFERPKYGVLNITSDLHGVASCYGYGMCYFVLREVRLRTTFVGQDSFGIYDNANQLVATCQYYGNILIQFNDQELNEVIEIATGKYPFGKPKDTNQNNYQNFSINAQYKEVQLHGEIRFNKHIQTLCCRRKEWCGDARKLDQLLQQFRVRNPMVEVIEID